MINQRIKKQEQQIRRKNRVRAKIKGTADRPRLSVYRSLKHIYAQIIDDLSGKVLVQADDSQLKDKQKTTSTQVAGLVGELIATKAQEQKIEQVIFDRNKFLYHGRVKALADGARKQGLKF